MPHTSDEQIDRALAQHLASRSADTAWDFGKYNTLAMARGTSYPDLVNAAPLLKGFITEQPEMRFKPNQIASRLERRMLEPCYAAEGVPASDLSKIVARRIVCMCYHFRRLMNPTIECKLRGMSDSEWATLSDILRLLKRGRALRRELSTASADSTMLLMPPSSSARSDDDDTAADDDADDNEDDDEELDSELQDLFATSAGSAPSTTSGSAPSTSTTYRVSTQAANAAARVLPPQRGAIKELTKAAKKPRKALETRMSPSFGQVKLCIFTEKSYILRFDSVTKKWPLVIEVSKPGHANTIQTTMGESARRQGMLEGFVETLSSETLACAQAASVSCSSSRWTKM